MSETLANEVMVTLLDAEQSLHDTMPTGMADVILAALTAEPETLEELEAAITRYDQAILQRGFLRHLQTGVNETKWDAGIIIIDLPARLIVADTEAALYEPAALGFALFCPDPPPDWSNVPDDEVCWIRYRLSEDWRLTDALAYWREIADQRRRERAAQPPFDARPVLFGQLAEFIARECLAARDAGHTDPLIEIHERWLLTPRADLRGQVPREVLLARREFVDYDLDSREMQWTFTGACPSTLNTTATTYCYSGFGTHSNVVYFDLLRYLLDQCWQQVRNDPSVQLTAETARLAKLQNDWLAEGGDYQRRSPGWILEQERRRQPITTTLREMLQDHDQPTSQPQTEPEFGIGFWHLDGSGMDEDNWVFSFNLTRADWEAEQRKWEEFNRKFAEEEAQRRAETEWAAGEQIHDDRKSKADEATDEDVLPF